MQQQEETRYYRSSVLEDAGVTQSVLTGRWWTKYSHDTYGPVTDFHLKFYPGLYVLFGTQEQRGRAGTSGQGEGAAGGGGRGCGRGDEEDRGRPVGRGEKFKIHKVPENFWYICRTAWYSNYSQRYSSYTSSISSDGNTSSISSDLPTQHTHVRMLLVGLERHQGSTIHVLIDWL